MTDWILLIHLGPVQDFIASARRCRDLWYGSKLLSFLARAATDAMVKHSGVERSEALIFPGQIKEGGSVANKIQLQLNGKSRDEVEAIAKAGQDGMSAALQEAGAHVFDDVIRELDNARKSLGDFDRKLAELQLKDLMEFMWVAVPIQEKNYSAARSQAERLLAGRKNARDWAQVPPIEQGRPKSSLDGVRESVLNEAAVFGKPSNSSGYGLNERRKIFGVSGSERLCGVGLIKRKGEDPDWILTTNRDPDDPPVFHSAAHIASAGLRARIMSRARTNVDVRRHWDEYIKQLLAEGVNLRDHRVLSGEADEWTFRSSENIGEQKIPRVMPMEQGHWIDVKKRGYDGGLLYASRLKTLLENETGESKPDDPRRKRLEEKLSHLFKAVGLTSEPYPYYAMILADGDKMGEALDKMKSPEEHRKFSVELEQNFAGKALEIVESHGGSLIYSGGDDVLAIVPVCTVLACSRALKECFDMAMEPLGLVKPPTLSVGVAIAHFLEPFANVRDFAKQAEKAAKNDANRNGLAILVKKRGGVPKLVFGRWDGTIKDSSVTTMSLDKRIERWADLQRKAKLPRGFAHQIEEIADSLEPKDKKETSADTDFVISLVKRVIRRRDVKELAVEFDALFLNYLELTKEKDTYFPYKAVRRFSDEFQIAAEFRKAFAEVTEDFEEHTQGAAE